MKSSGDSDKWNRIYANGEHGKLEAAKVLRENTHLLPSTGKALDLACGLGANALLLAQHGLETCAWDISQTALDKLHARALKLNVLIQVESRDVSDSPPSENSFDVIVVSHFLERSLMPKIITALRDNGLIYYQTFTQEKTTDSGPGNPDYLLVRNELLHSFSSLQLIYYREEGKIGDVNQGFRNEAMIIARNSMDNT